jgi:DNA-binding sugar fermentation-stimulating protein
MPAVVLLKNGQDVYLSCDNTGAVHSFLTVEEGVAAHEKESNRQHKRGYEASMSQAIAHIQLQVGIIDTKDVEEMYTWVGPEPKITRLRSIAVSAMGVQLLPEHCHLFEKSSQPRLISPE